MDDTKRAFLQTLVARKTLAEREAIRLMIDTAKLFPGPRLGPENYGDFVTVLNQQLRPLFMRIATGVREDTGERVVALVNDVPDESAKLATGFEPREILYFRQLIEEIMQAEDGTLSSMDALNIVTEASRSKKELETLCKRLLDDGWLVQPSKGVYSLGPRTMLELATQLKTAYADWAEDCTLCQTLVVLGQRCGNVDCHTKFHFHCLRQFGRAAGGALRCPACRAEWTGTLPPPPPPPPADTVPPPPTPSAAAAAAAGADDARRTSGRCACGDLGRFRCLCRRSPPMRFQAERAYVN